DLPGETTLYLPYPEEMSADNYEELKASVTHEGADGAMIYSIENGSLAGEAQGLRMEVASLGLFEIGWEAEAPDPGPSWNEGFILEDGAELAAIGYLDRPAILLNREYKDTCRLVFTILDDQYNGRVYEIRLVNGSGSDVDLPGETTLYLPYADVVGMDKDNCVELCTAIGQVVGDPPELQNLPYTPAAEGLGVAVTALGTFEMSWEADEPEGPSWDEGFILEDAAELADIGHLDRPAILLNREYKDTCHLVFNILEDRYNGRVYEIRLVDGSGNDVDLPGETTLYLPYADVVGMDKDNCEDMGTAIGQVVGDPPELQILPYTPAEEGLGVAVSTLGTFEMSWEAKEPEGPSEEEGVIMETVEDFERMLRVDTPVMVLPKQFLEDMAPRLLYQLVYEDPYRNVYQVRLVDAEENDVDLPEPSLLCLPYPAGMDEYNFEDVKVTVVHDANGEEFTYSLENGKLSPSVQGLLMQVDQLGIFEISWQGIEIPANRKGQILEDMSQLENNPPVKVPTIILPPGFQEAVGAALVYEHIPATSTQSILYDVKLVDPLGNDVPLPEAAMLCFPYPEGMDEVNCGKYRITILHDSVHGQELFSLDDGTLVTIRQGLCVEVSDLSPFVISWQERAVIPETGDPSQIALWVGMMLVSLAMLMKLRKRSIS
ncbi:MAG: LPXTG cell wall anchor domain-containing protein, partial [Clostridia bacterium]|nr:LPXTG cell wall anchor domain-containing protein [Clostridia bacterium]